MARVRVKLGLGLGLGLGVGVGVGLGLACLPRVAAGPMGSERSLLGPLRHRVRVRRSLRG